MLPAIAGIAGSIMGMGTGIIGAAQQQGYNEDTMNMQYHYNEKMAKNNQKRNKELWDYTNYENQVQHMEKAGLNKSLLYGMGGGGGATAAGGSGSGVSAQGGQVSAGAQMGQMALAAAKVQSEIKLNEAAAKKTETEAEKIGGVDTEQVKATTENLIQQTKNASEQRQLIRAETRLTDAKEILTQYQTNLTEGNYGLIQKQIEQYTAATLKMNEEIRGVQLDNQLKERTMEANVQDAIATVSQKYADIAMKKGVASLTNEQAEAVGEQIKQGWANVKNQTSGVQQGWRTIELNAEKITNDLNLGKENLDIKDKQLVKDWVMGIGQLVIGGINAVTNAKK